MEEFITSNPITISNLKFPPPPIFLFHFPCIPRKFLPVRHVASSLSPSRKTRCPSIPAGASSAGCGGWDELVLVGEGESAGPGEPTREFLVALGIYDKRLAFSFLLGIVAAFSVSRVRVSSILVFPASVLVFAVGFFCGFFHGGSFSEFGGIGARNMVKDETLRVYSENLKRLLVFFDRFDAKADDFESEVQNAIDRREIGWGDLENYVGVIESMKLLASDARNALDGSVRSLGRSGGSVPVENQKSSSGKKNVVGEVGVEFLQLLGGLFRGRSVGSKSGKVKEKETVKQDRAVGVADDQLGSNGKSPSKRHYFGSVASEKEDRRSRISQSTGYNYGSDWERDRRFGKAHGNGHMNHIEADRIAARFSHREEYSYQNNRILFTGDDYLSQKMERNDEIETGTSHDSLVDSVDFSVSSGQQETESSFVKGHKCTNAYKSSHTRRMMMMEEEAYHLKSRKSGENSNTVWLEDDEFMLENEVRSSSSVVSDDVMFDRYLTEANDLLQQAKVCIKGRSNEDHVEVILYQSAELLTKAITMKPMSLLAVGQLGNTYLLHGELKLRISRELRTILIRRGPLSAERHRRILKVLDDQVVTKDKIKSALVNTCEECEELLVEAGRKYRFALSIDGNDVRALYNWGLALSYRAQLIADIGPEAALDADKVFLAAIDKFDAMMSKGNVYAPDALYRWGMTLQQRSRLRPSTSRERMKLLQQAKRLYEDALSMDGDNSQVRGALLSCASELNYRNL